MVDWLPVLACTASLVLVPVWSRAWPGGELLLS